MQQSAERSAVPCDAPSPFRWEDTSASGLSSFANALASLASPDRKFGVSRETAPPRGRKPSLSWNDDDLAEDVANLSYERALRAHSRLRPVEPEIADFPAPEPNDGIDQACLFDTSPETQTANLPGPADSIGETERGNIQDKIHDKAIDGRAHDFPVASARNLKCESITIRMSRSESAQLRGRAAEAGLTISAYLRSCTFEAESLRALVKDTMAQLKSASSQRSQTAPSPRTWMQWLARLWPRAGRRTVQA